MTLFERLPQEALLTLYDLAPITIVITLFLLATHKRPTQLSRIVSGIFYLFVGLTLFRLGLSGSLIPIGGLMAEQLLETGTPGHGFNVGFIWLCLFAVMLGFTATLIEPTLIAVGERVSELTGDGISSWTLRAVIAGGVALGLLVGTLRILHGIPLGYIIIPALLTIAILIMIAPKTIVPLALDSGGMATSVVTVPLITAFGISVADLLADRDPLVDGFGLILMALLFPVITLLAFASIQFRRHRDETRENMS